MSGVITNSGEVAFESTYTARLQRVRKLITGINREMESLDESERLKTWLMLQQLIGGDVGRRGSGGFIDYNDTSTSAVPLTLPDGVWVELPNDGLGAFTNKNYAPVGVSELMDTPSGHLNFTELDLGDGVFIRHDFEVTPDVDQASLELRYSLGAGAGSYVLERTVGQLTRGAGIPYRQSLLTDLIYMGDENTRLNPAVVAVRLSGASGTCVNYGVVLEVLRA